MVWLLKEYLNLIKVYRSFIQVSVSVLFLIFQVYLWLHLLRFSVLWQWKSSFHPCASIIQIGNSRLSRKSITDNYLRNVKTVRGRKRVRWIMRGKKKKEYFLECNSLPLRSSKSNCYLKPLYKRFLYSKLFLVKSPYRKQTTLA